MRIQQVVDLSRPIQPGMQVYPGDPVPMSRPVTTIAEDGFWLHELTFGSQTGTHIDAPAHVLPGATTTGQIRLTQLVGETTVIDCTTVDSGELIQPDLLNGQTLAAERGVLFRTDWDRHDGTDHAWRHPGLSVSTAEALVRHGIAFVGIDAASIDRHGEPDLPAHRVLARARIPIIENLTGLVQLDWPNPLVIVAPLPWVGLDGASARVLALRLGPDLPQPRPDAR